jgi:protein gp37
MSTDIQWTHQDGYIGETWNPIAAFNIETGKRGWACTKPSAGCKNCYAEAMNRFRGTGLTYTVGNLDKVELRLMNVDQPLHWRMPRVVFVCSMTDLFHERHADKMIARIFATMAHAQRHTFIVLTKRPERMRDLLNDPDFAVEMVKRVRDSQGSPDVSWLQWPLPNVRLGTTIENDDVANDRVTALLSTSAAVRFLSVEPLLEGIDMTPFLVDDLHWVIVGGESGRHARPFNVQWAHDIIGDCREAGIPVFIKQLGSRPWTPDLTHWRSPATLRADRNGYDLHLRDSHGGDASEWPAELRVREFPTLRAGAGV